MASSELKIVRRMRSVLGAKAVVEAHEGEPPRVAPRNDDAVALVLQTAAANRWTVRVEGAGSWQHGDGPGDLVLTTRDLTAMSHLDAGDLVASAEAGMPWDDLRRQLADRGTWVAADPPGHGRTLGSVVATGTAGPLRAGFGGVRDQLLGVTVVTGNGRVIRVGGRVVKNVAGFDLTKVVAGSFGMFGVVTTVHLRLRAVPREDLTLVATGSRDNLLQQARAVLEAGHTPAALELFSPQAAGRDAWALTVRLSGSPIAVRTTGDAIRGIVDRASELDSAEATTVWREAAVRAVGAPLTVRLGTLSTALDDALDLITHHLSEEWISVTVPAGAIRWSGHASAEHLKLLRHQAAQLEMPVTLERAPWDVRNGLGHFGAYREGVGRLVDRLRRTFDPAGVLVVARGDNG